jgi:hypothetical protein
MELPNEDVKIYVQVNVIFREDGLMLPNEIIWASGVSYKINRITQICYGFTFRTNCVGNRYRVVIDGQERYLYFEQNPNSLKNPVGRWFVEKRSA